MIRRRNPMEPPGPDVGLLVDRGAPDDSTDVVLVYLPGFREVVHAAGHGVAMGIERRVPPERSMELSLESVPWATLLGHLELGDARYGDAREQRCGNVAVAEFSWSQPDWYPLLYDAGIYVADKMGLGFMSLREGGLSKNEMDVWKGLSQRSDVASDHVPVGCDTYFDQVLDRIYRPGRGFPKREFSGMLKRMKSELREAKAATGLSEAEVVELMLKGAKNIMFFSPPKPVERRRIANQKARRMKRRLLNG